MSIEKILERRLIRDVKKHGGYCLKFLPYLETGIPDRICILPNGIIIFVELKSPGKTLSPKQIVWRNRLTDLQHEFRVIDSEKAYGNFLKMLYALRLKPTK